MTESFDSARLAADRNADPERKPRCSNCRRWSVIKEEDAAGELVSTGLGWCVRPTRAKTMTPSSHRCSHHSYTPAIAPPLYRP